MAKFSIELLGDRELEQTLSSLTDQMERKVLATAFRSAARTVLDDARRRAPTRQVHIAAGTGKRRTRQLQRLATHFAGLKNSLSLKTLRRRKGRVGFLVTTGTREELGIADKWYYPAHVELGHAGPHRGGRSPHAAEFGDRRTPPHPYLRPALLGNEAKILAELGEQIRAAIERELSKPVAKAPSR